MVEMSLVSDKTRFVDSLFEKMKQIAPAIEELEPYEFRYCLRDLTPEGGWESITLDPKEQIEELVNDRTFYNSIQITPKVDGRIVLDEQALRLSQMLLAGIVSGDYPVEWVKKYFYFDVRGFYFLHRTVYFTDRVLAHFGGKPFQTFAQKQKQFEHYQAVGYKDFKAANAEVDALFVRAVMNLIAEKKTPLLIAIAGPTAAGKTEIVERLTRVFERAGQKIASIELDNFLTDRDYREAHGIHTQGKQALHFELLLDLLKKITHGQRISTPRYDTLYATSSHDLNGNLKPDGIPVEIEPADIIFIEGNFPFLYEEVASLIGIKVVYLTDDPVRLKRKWKRDIDYRKKYEPTYFRNRFFKDQFIMAQIAYIPQLEVCDLAVDTTAAALWATPEIAEIISRECSFDLAELLA